MANIGYTMMCEQRAPRDLVADVVRAEAAGFDFSVISDHYHPWVSAQGHSGYAWSILGAAAQATDRIPLMTYVTTPIIRYHPAIVAQKAATIAILSNGRFRLGLGAGEELNEHVVGKGFPPVTTRHLMLTEAVSIIRQLFGGNWTDYRGTYFEVDDARLFDLPDVPPQIGIAAGGKHAAKLAGTLGDMMIATQPDKELVAAFTAAGGHGKPVIGQLPVCWGTDEAACRKLAKEQFAWSTGGWKIQSELPNTPNFEAFAGVVPEEAVAQAVPCGPDLDQIVDAYRGFTDAGFTDVALVQIGDDQAGFCDLFARELGPKLRAA